MSEEGEKIGEHEGGRESASSRPDKPHSTSSSNPPAAPKREEAARTILQLPGLAAISLYMLILACVVVAGAIGRHYPPLFLILAAAFFMASFGLMRLKRWAWALTLSAVVLLVAYCFWIFEARHEVAALVQSLLNLVFFLYLVRLDVREKLR